MVSRILTLVTTTALAVTLSVAGLGTGAEAAAKPGGQAWVERAQQQLNELGCNAGPANGELGVWTRAAIIRFQSRYRLDQSGRLSPETRTRLYAESPRLCNTRPVPAHTGKGRRIVVSQRQNWVWLVRNDGTIAAQSGAIDNPRVLRPGTSRVGSYCGRAARIKHNTDGHGLGLENFVRFAPCGIGFHRIPVSRASKKQIHPAYLVGTNLRASHGCLRLPKPFSRTVWQFGRVGTPVHVVRG